VSARAVRSLRERIERTRDLTLTLDREALFESVGSVARLEEEPNLYVRGMLVHEGLRAHAGVDGRGPIELRLDSGHAVGGALWTTIAAAAIAAVGLWLYGLLVALTGAGVAWGLRRWWPTVARRAPRFLPRGRLLGAAAAAAAITLLGIAVIYPIREIRRPDNLSLSAPAVVR
jgi:hypothetical protein